MPERFQIGETVRVRNNPSEAGPIVKMTDLPDGNQLAHVNLTTGPRRFPVSQLERMPELAETPSDLIRNGHLPGPTELRRQISHVRLSGNLADIFYSMESSHTDFYAHQFKPVVKILESPTGNLLIADEVGLGKTIEAGLIWTELSARYKYNRLLVVCPKVLCQKWREELTSKFGIDAQICDAKDLHDTLSNSFKQRSGFAVVCGMQSIRPRPKEKRGKRLADQLAELLEENQGLDRLVDLVVIDEAHHMRNSGTQTNYLGQLLCGIAEHVVMLSATPINLHNRDLLSLLRLIDELTFRDEDSLEQIICANQPLVAARDAALAGRSVDEVFQLLLAASRAPILRKAASLKKLISELREETELSPAQRAEIARRLERVNLLSNVINRTRRRDVEELRVHRDVSAYRIEMTGEERQVYDAITTKILDYALDQGLPTGFLTVMPQRMLASSIPAALEHWRQNDFSTGFEDEDDQEVDETSNDAASRTNLGPLTQVLARLVRYLPPTEEMAEKDSKFSEFLRVLRERFMDSPDEKIVVFSTFRPTLAYLGRRLEEEDIRALTIHGGTEKRADLIKDFERLPDVRVLLASEVASEGIDLQFARTVVNYDLPWNPMRVEQRIGRVDRLGQASPTISVLNLLHARTVDERIYHRLHERLGLCQKALGGFEDILGRDIANLTRDLLSGKLTEEEERRRLDQTEQAIANMRREEVALEREAASLFAHGDYIVQSIKESRSEGNWLTDADIVDYVEASLQLLYPGSAVQWQKSKGLATLNLSEDCRYHFESWCEKEKLSNSPIGRRAGPVVFKVGEAEKRLRHPRLSPTHPFMRFLSHHLEAKAGLRALSTSIRLPAKDAPGLEPGVYVGAIEEWEFGKGVTSTTIGSALVSMHTKKLFESEVADRATAACMAHGEHWPIPAEEADLNLAADYFENILEPDLAARFMTESVRREAETSDRINLQLESLEEHVRKQRSNFDRIIHSAGKRLEAANRARLERFEESIRLRKRRIEAQSVNNPSSRQMGVFLLKVFP